MATETVTLEKKIQFNLTIKKLSTSVQISIVISLNKGKELLVEWFEKKVVFN